MAEALPELEPFDRRFAEAYAGVAAGNGAKAMEIAGHEGDAAVRATLAWRKLRIVEVRAYIDAMLESDPLVAGRVERLRFLTAVVRGEITEPRSTRDEDGNVVIEQCKPSIRDRLAAQEALSKISGEQVTKVAPVDSQGNDLRNAPLAEVMALAQMGKVG